jgi:hypothetical protein
MTVYELIQALTKYEPDDDVYMVDGGDEVAVESVEKDLGGIVDIIVIKPWESYRRADNEL